MQTLPTEDQGLLLILTPGSQPTVIQPHVWALHGENPLGGGGGFDAVSETRFY